MSDTTEKTFPALTLEEVAARLQAADSVLIFIHRGPDGDCVGSATALAYMLDGMGKKTAIACADQIPHYLTFLLPPWTDATYTDGMENDFDLCVSTDVASPQQLGALSALAEKIALSVDHHEMNCPFCPNHTEGEASATAEILFDLYAMWKKSGVLAPNADIARALYTGILTDTGNFKQTNTTLRTFRTATALFEEISLSEDGGDDVPMLCHRLYDCRTLRDLQASRLSIECLRLVENGRIGIVFYTQELLKANNLTQDDVSGSVSLPRSVEGVEIALSVKQDEDDPTKWFISSRSVGKIDVSAVCVRLGGGGHRNAAGCTITAPNPSAALNLVLSEFSQAL